MLTFSEYLLEMDNTKLSDINEILIGFFLNNNRWFSSDAKNFYEERIKGLSKQEISNEKDKAKEMSVAFINWAKENNYSGMIKKLWWTARPGTISAIVKQPVDQSKNPSDLLVQFTSGPSNGFLGISAKSIKINRGRLVYKNPGLSTFDAALGLKLNDYAKEKIDQFVKEKDLPLVNSARANYIRELKDNKQLKEIERYTFIIYQHIRNELLAHFKSMPREDVVQFIYKNCLDSEIIYPPYIILSAKGTKSPFKINVTNPISNPKLESLALSDLTFDKKGVDTVVLKGDNKNILLIRIKFKDIKLSSNLKFSISG